MNEKEVLKCPKCGVEMESGYLDIRSPDLIRVFFTKEKPSRWRVKGDNSLEAKWLGHKVTTAHRCRKRQIVVFDYKKKPDDAMKAFSHEGYSLDRVDEERRYANHG